MMLVLFFSEQKPKTMETRNIYTFFFGSSSPFSNWYPAIFWVDGIKYSSMEQYMMYQKALLFEDQEIASKIISSSQPRFQKNCGRKVKNFDIELWKRKRYSIVKRGIFAKFSQNLKIKRALLETKGTLLVEASPTDCIWGVGLHMNDPLIKDYKKWRGHNLLGHILTDVRDMLLANPKSGFLKKRKKLKVF